MDRSDAAHPGDLSAGDPLAADLRADPVVSDLLLRCRFPSGAVVCGVSGGADSSALLILAVAAGCRVTAIHVDHGLREGSAAEAATVEKTSTRFGATFESRAARVEPGPDLEARARSARRAALPHDALLGHTADDQAETVLLNLLRGAGIDGLAGIRADERHPLLGLRRRETAALCDHLGVEVVIDPSNDDPAFRRNRVRHEVLPLLDDVAQRDVVPLLARLAGHAREAVDALDDAARSLDPTDVVALRAAPDALARRALRGWLRSLSPDRHPPDSAAIDRVMALVGGARTATEIAGGWRVARRAGRLRVEPARPDGVGE